MKGITHQYKYYPEPIDQHEWKINVEGFKGDVWVVMHPSVTSKDYYTIGIINLFTHHRQYGFSDYKNESKYVIKAMLEDINEYKETGNFSQSTSRLSRLK